MKIRQDFIRFFLVLLLLSTIIDEVIVLIFLFGVALQGTGSLSVSWLLLAQLLPAILFSPVGGYVNDRYGARATLAMSSIPQAGLIALSGFTDFSSAIYGIAALLSICFAFSGPAIFSLLPVFAARTGLTVERANSLIELVRGLGAVAGPVVGGVLIEALDFAMTLQFIALWTLLLPLSVFVIKLDSRKSSHSAGSRGIFKRITQSYRPVIRNWSIMILFFTFGIIVFSTSFSDVLFIFFATLELSASPLTTGIMMASWALGLALAAGYSGTSHSPVTTLNFAYIGGIIMGVSLFASGILVMLLPTPQAVIAVVLLFLSGGVGNGLHNVSVRNAIHNLTPQGQHGRAFSVYVTISRIAIICGFFSGGLLGAENAISAYIMAGALAIIMASLGWTIQRWKNISV